MKEPAATRRVLGAMFVVALGLGLGACPIPLEGRLASAHPMRDVHAPRPVASRQAECGALRVDRVSPIRRAPYLQQVTHDRATLLWTSTAVPPERVAIYLPDDDEDLRRVAVSRVADLGDVVQRAAMLDDLSPATTYCYEVHAHDHALLYGPVAFRTAPEPGSSGPIDVIALGDSGGGGRDQRAVRDQMLRVPADLVLHAGDLAYPTATRARLDERVFDMYEPLLRAVPMHPVLGNHDRKADGGAPYLAAFALPENGRDERWYSFDWGPLHIAAIDTGGDLEEQATWLERDLEQSDAPWKIVIGHHPPFSSGWHGSDDAMRTTIVPVLERRGVRLAIFGHDHHYERTRPIGGVTYVITGGGGHSIRAASPHEHTAISEPVLHFVHLRVTDRTISLLAIDARGDVFDSHDLVRE